MTQSVIPNSFELYLQNKLTANEPVSMNRIVLANIPNLNPDTPVDRNETLPPTEQIVHEQDVDQVGKVNSNAVVYSIVMDTSVGDFDFNAMYLIDKDERTAIGMIVHKETETKTATDETDGTQGNNLVKSMLMEFDGAAAAVDITVDASTWQIDYSARLKGMDEDIRLQALDAFGHDAFIDDGFLVTEASGNQVFVNLGLSYIGGLRAELIYNQTLIIDALPSFIYAKVSRQGTALSAFANTVALQVSETELTDYTENGVSYFVAKIATVNADGTVTDERTTSLNEQQFTSLQSQLDDLDADLQGHKGADDPHSQYLLTAKFLRAMLGKPVHESIVGRAQDDDLIAPAVGQKLYVADYPTAYEIISQADNFIDEATKAADPFQYAGYWGFGNDGADFFTPPNLPLTIHIKSAGSYGNASESKEDHLQKITGNFNHIWLSSGFGIAVANTNGAFHSADNNSENYVLKNTFLNSSSDLIQSGKNYYVNLDTSRVARTDSFTDSMGTFFDPYIWLPKGEF